MAKGQCKHLDINEEILKKKMAKIWRYKPSKMSRSITTTDKAVCVDISERI